MESNSLFLIDRENFKCMKGWRESNCLEIEQCMCFDFKTSLLVSSCGAPDDEAEIFIVFVYYFPVFFFYLHGDGFVERY